MANRLKPPKQFVTQVRDGIHSDEREIILRLCSHEFVLPISHAKQLARELEKAWKGE